MLELAHPDIEVRPRAQAGRTVHRGIEGVRRWLDGTRRWLDGTREQRPNFVEYSLSRLDDSRVLAESTLAGMPICALFDLKEGKIAGVRMFLSDRELLAWIQEIAAPPAASFSFRVGHDPDAPPG